MATLTELLVKIGVDPSGVKPGMDKAGGFVRQHGAKVLAAAGAIAGAAATKGIVDNIAAESAVDKMAAQIGLTEQVSARVGQVAGDLFADAYGSSLGEVNDALVGIHRNIGDVGSISNAELSSMGAQALDLATVMDEDVGRVTRSVGQLMRNDLAPNAQAAFDLVAAASQSPANATGDLIDTIEEYSADFAALGLTGPQAMGALSGAMEAGARNTDLVADAFREFGIRVLDGSDLSRGAVESLGMDYDSLAKTIAGGGPAAAKATSEVIQALSGVGDKVAQEQIGVALFGTRFEELGPKAIGAMDPVAGAMDNVDGAMDNVDGAAGRLGDTLNDNAQTKIETWRRKFDQALMGLVDAPGLMGSTAVAAAGLGGAVLPLGGDLGGMALGMATVGKGVPGLVSGLGKVASGFGSAAGAVGRAVLSVVTGAGSIIASTAGMVASTVASTATMVARWAFMGVQSLLHAAKVCRVVDCHGAYRHCHSCSGWSRCRCRKELGHDQEGHRQGVGRCKAGHQRRMERRQVSSEQRRSLPGEPLPELHRTRSDHQALEHDQAVHHCCLECGLFFRLRCDLPRDLVHRQARSDPGQGPLLVQQCTGRRGQCTELDGVDRPRYPRPNPGSPRQPGQSAAPGRAQRDPGPHQRHPLDDRQRRLGHLRGGVEDPQHAAFQPGEGRASQRPGQPAARGPDHRRDACRGHGLAHRARVGRCGSHGRSDDPGRVLGQGKRSPGLLDIERAGRGADHRELPRHRAR